MITLDAKDFCQYESSLNTALALASLLKKEIKIINIDKLPITSVQSLTVLKEATNAYVEGGILNSNELIFQPTKEFNLKKAEFELDRDSSFLEILQSLLIPILFSNKKTHLKIKGGTHLTKISLEYLKEVLINYLQKYTKGILLKLNSIGFFSEGEFELIIDSKTNLNNIEPINIQYHSNLIGIKTHLTLTNDLEKYAKPIRQLLELSFPEITIITLPKSKKCEKSCLVLDSFALFGKDDNFDNKSPYIKHLSKVAPKEISLNSESFQKAILNYIKELKEILNKDGIDETSSIFLLPIIGLSGGEIIVHEVTQEIKSLIFVIENILNINFKIKDKSISNEIISINDL